VAGDWKRMHNEELCNEYVLPSIIRVIKSRRKGLAAHVARMGEMSNTHKHFTE